MSDEGPEMDDLSKIDKEMAEDQRAAEEAAAFFQQYSEAFDKLCAERHEAGAAEYGQLTFLGNDVIRMMVEEMADTANYCRYQFIKLMILQETLEEELSAKGLSNGVKFEPFKGTGEVGWVK